MLKAAGQLYINEEKRNWVKANWWEIQKDIGHAEIEQKMLNSASEGMQEKGIRRSKKRKLSRQFYGHFVRDFNAE